MVSLKESKLLSTTLKLPAHCVLPHLAIILQNFEAEITSSLVVGSHSTDRINAAYTTFCLPWERNNCLEKSVSKLPAEPLPENSEATWATTTSCAPRGRSAMLLGLCICTLCEHLAKHHPFFVVSTTMAFKGQWLLLFSCLSWLT